MSGYRPKYRWSWELHGWIGPLPMFGGFCEDDIVLLRWDDGWKVWEAFDLELELVCRGTA